MTTLLYRSGLALGAAAVAAVGASISQGWRPQSVTQAASDVSKYAQGSGAAVSRAAQDVASGSRIVFGAIPFKSPFISLF